MKKIIFKLLCCALILLIASGCDPLMSLKKPAEKPLVIKPEDFSVFLFESSEEIYRANVKSAAMWAGLREQADHDVDYAMHYKWLYDTYAKWDDYRRNQLKEIMNIYHPQPMSERLISRGKQAASLDEIIRFMKEDRFFSKNRGMLVDFYSWYGANYAQPHYERIVPLLQHKAKIASGMVEEGFDIVEFMEKETGIKLKKKPDAVELLLNMRLIGVSGFSRDKDSLYTIRWNDSQEKIWAVAFNEFSGPFFRTFTGGWSFKLLAGKMKKDEALLTKFKEDVPYTWEGWIEKNLTEGFARYLVVSKGITGDTGEGVYIFDRDYARALLKGFDARKTSLEDFTLKYLKQKYDIGK